MATSTALPAACPLCGYVFGLTDVPTQETHYLAHLAVLSNDNASMQTVPRDPTKDW